MAAMDVHIGGCVTLPVSVEVSCFRGKSGVGEYHFMLRPTECADIETQLEWLESAYRHALDSLGLDRDTAVFRRFFASDLPNQAAALEARPFSHPHRPETPCAVSWVGQPPQPPAKAALWAYHQSDPGGALDKTQEGASLTLRRGELAHYWTTGITRLSADTSCGQTRGVFEQYEAFLHARNLSLADHVIRTWLFVRDIDANYRGMVVARREFFAQRGLVPGTHFIASSGIGSVHVQPATKVAMDAYAIAGLRPGQVEFLAAPEHLPPTHFYGVTFERGTSVAWRDRKHVVISGTASIDHRGRILHPGDVSRQLDRTLENVEALLARAGAAPVDLRMCIVYVRDPGDQAAVRREMRGRLPGTPLAVVVASVCRPGWLIEVEGMAIVPACNPQLPAF